MAEDQLDPVIMCFSFEDFEEKLFAIIEIDFTLSVSVAEYPAKSV